MRRRDLQAARGRTLPDIAAADLRILFCGINPSLWSAAVGHHFARPGNRFWRTLHLAGFTPVELSPYQDAELLRFGFGLTNMVARATASADEVSVDEFKAGAALLEKKVRRWKPEWVAFVGIGAYRAAFGPAEVGPQEGRLAGARVWLLPSPSGRNAHYRLVDLVEAYRALRRSI